MDLWNRMTVTGIDSIFTVPSAKGRYARIEYRPTYGLSFCRDGGRITYVHNGQRYVSDRSCAVLLPMGETYELYGDEEGEFTLINFHCDWTVSARQFCVTPLHHVTPYLLDFDRLHSLWNSNATAYRAEQMAILYTMLARLATEQPKEAADTISPLLAPAMDRLSHKLYCPELSVAALAAGANLSETYFRRLFKQLYGVSPKQYILERRIFRAKQLLSEHSASVSVIAEHCGFSSLYHFSRAFKEATGMSPTEYMQGSRREP